MQYHWFSCPDLSFLSLQDTPPPEEWLQQPEPFPSMSTPSKSHHRYGNNQHRPRRHTITRPDSALALLSDFDDDDGHGDDDGDDQDSGNEETFDRISGILNNLLQEANDAVKRDHHHIEEEEEEEEYEDIMEEKNQINTQDNNEMQQQPPPPIAAPPTRHNKQTPPSRLPRSSSSRIRPSSLLVQQQQNRIRGSSISSSTSSSSSSTSSFCLDDNNDDDQQPLFSPSSPTSSSIATSPTASIGPSSPLPTEYPNNKQSVATIIKKPYRQRPSVRPLSCPTLAIQRRPTTPINSRPMSRRASATQTLLRDPLIESYKRLDSSMALVESLSRDLASLEKEGDDEEESSTLSSSSSSKTTTATTTTTTTMLLHHDNNYTPNGNNHQQQHYAALTAARKLLAATTRNENQQQQPLSMVDPRLSALLILPLLHIPHTLISMVFESMSTTEPHHLTGMIAWAFFFAFANVMVDRVVISTSRPVQWLTRRLSVPGAYDNDSTSSSCSSSNAMSLSSKDISNTSKVTSPTTPTRGQICFQRRSGRRVILPRRSSVYRKIQQRPSPLLHDAMRHGGSSSMYTLDQQQQQYAALAITRSRTQPGYNNNNNAYYYNTTTTPQSPLSIAPTATTSSLRPMIHRRNSF